MGVFSLVSWTVTKPSKINLSTVNRKSCAEGAMSLPISYEIYLGSKIISEDFNLLFYKN